MTDGGMAARLIVGFVEKSGGIEKMRQLRDALGALCGPMQRLSA